MKALSKLFAFSIAVLLFSGMLLAQDSTKAEPKLKNITIIVDGSQGSEYYICSWFDIWDACSHYGYPESHPIMAGGYLPDGYENESYFYDNYYVDKTMSGVEKVVFLRSQNNEWEGTRKVRFVYLDGEICLFDVPFFYENRDGEELPGLQSSHFEPGAQCEFSDDNDEWSDLIRIYHLGGFRYFKLDDVKAIVFNYK